MSLRAMRRPTGCLLGLTLALTLCHGSLLHANERVDARKFFQAGMAMIQARQYQEGIALLEKAWLLVPHPSVLYNIGRAWNDAGELEKAVDYLQRYVQTEPPDKAEVSTLLEEIRRKIEVSKLPPPAPAPVQPKVAPSAPVASAKASQELQAVAQQLQSLTTQLNTLIAEGRAGEVVAAASGSNSEGGNSGSSGSSGRNSDGTRGAAEVLDDAASQDRGQSSAGDSSGNPNTDGSGADGSGAQDSTGSEAGRDSAGNAAPRSLADPYAPVVVTSSRYSQSPLDAPNALTVILGDEIRRSGAHNLAEVLRRVPGLSAMAISPSDYNVGIRGFNSPLANKVLVLVDGRSVYLDFVGATLWPMLSISPSDIERIEVIRGPGAALYGANAFSGVINIITRAPGAADDRTSVSVRGGLPDWSSGDFHITGKQGRAAYRASVGFERLERWATEVDPARDDYQQNAAWTDQSSHINRLDARVDQRLGASFLSLSGGLASGQAEFQALGALRDYLVDGTYSYLRGDLVLPLDINVSAFWNHVDFRAAPWTTPTGGLDLTSTPRSDVFDISGEWDHEFSGPLPQRLNAGLGFRYKAIDWQWLDEEPREPHFNVYVQDELRLRSDLSGTLSLRYDRHPVLAHLTDGGFLDKNPLSPRAALLWRMGETRSLRGAIGTAFRTPTFLENYIAQEIPTSNDAVVIVNRGSDQLKPERIFSFEVGYLELASSGLYELEATGYANRVSSLIGLGPIAPTYSLTETGYTPPTYDPQGRWILGETGFINEPGEYTSVGLELGGKLYPITGLEITGSYSYNYVVKSLPDGSEADSSTVIGTTVDGCDYEVRDCSVSPHRMELSARYGLPYGIHLGLDFNLTSRQIWGLRSFSDQGNVQIDYVAVPTYQWFEVQVDYRSPDGKLEAGLHTSNLLGAALGSYSTEEGDGAIPAPAGTHREYPLGQPVPAIFSVFTTWRF